MVGGKGMFDMKGKKVVILGAGMSGVGAAKVLNQMGAYVWVSDLKNEKEISYNLQELRDLGIKIVLGEHPDDLLDDTDLMVVSPAVPKWVSFVQRALERQIEVISEIELAYRFSNGIPFVAITGTNGKTTTTTLIGEIFKAAGKKTIVGGNIGIPLIEEIFYHPDAEVAVVEISSFQMEWVNEFKPRVSAILNITPDHLDRYDSFDDYAYTKTNIFRQQDFNDYVVLNEDDHETIKFEQNISAQPFFFSRQKKLSQGVYVENDHVVVADQGKKTVICPVKSIGIPGPHNLENALAAVAATYSMGVDKTVIADTLKSFKGVEHRLEFVAEINGVTFINDSKGTNCDAAMKALQSFTQPLILIAGGKDKGTSFDDFAVLATEKTREIILMGETMNKISQSLEKAGCGTPYTANSMKEAIDKAYNLAEPGDVVLLSPACSSFDMFNSYEHRGEIFKAEVERLRR